MHAPLPVHPRTGALALGWRKARPGEDESEPYPVWPILGGAEDDSGNDAGTEGDDDQDDDGTGDDDQDDGDDPQGADLLGDAGKKALDSMKGKWKSERDKRRELEQLLAQKDKGDGDDVEAQQAAAAATARANQRILKAEVRAAAAGKLADPRDALRLLDLDQFEVTEDGEVDAEEIADAIEDLLKSKPYLAAQGGAPKRFQGTADSGARKGTGRPAQLTEADVKRLAAQGKHADILKARDEGRLEDYLAPQ